MDLCPDSYHVQVFVSVSQNTFSQCLILLFWSQFTHSFWSQWQKSSEEKHQNLKTLRTVAEPNFGWVTRNSIAFVSKHAVKAKLKSIGRAYVSRKCGLLKPQLPPFFPKYLQPSVKRLWWMLLSNWNNHTNEKSVCLSNFRP